MLCRPTKVAAANCQALLPVSSHLGEGTSIDLPLDVFCCDDAHNPRFPNVGPYERNQSSLRQEPCQPPRPIESLVKPGASREIKGHSTEIAHKLGKGGRCVLSGSGARAALHRAAIWVWIDPWRLTRSCFATGSWRQE